MVSFLKNVISITVYIHYIYYFYLLEKKKMPKNKPNGFVLYANEIKNQLLREGHTIRGMPDLIHAASPRWQV